MLNTDKDSGLMRHDAMSIGKLLPTFQRRLHSLSSETQLIPKAQLFFDYLDAENAERKLLRNLRSYLPIDLHFYQHGHENPEFRMADVTY
jgi:hypothetical protein